MAITALYAAIYCPKKSIIYNYTTAEQKTDLLLSETAKKVKGFTINCNRKRGGAKAAATRRQKKLHRVSQVLSSSVLTLVCQLLILLC